ncbi:CPBP family intramembrane metalloprotease, partial [Bacillus paranthracis]|nr:CPBP family intramembrane metalloprotease [Bacillus paranthracis]
IFYLVVAVVMIVINPKRVLYGAEDMNSRNGKYYRA